MCRDAYWYEHKCHGLLEVWGYRSPITSQFSIDVGESSSTDNCLNPTTEKIMNPSQNNLFSGEMGVPIRWQVIVVK